MELQVSSIGQARQLIATGWPTYIISIVNDAGGEFPATDIDKAHQNHHIFNFHDVENDENEEYAKEYIIPTRDDVLDILSTAKSFPNDARILIHCTAGKSRSTAIALGVLIQDGMTVRHAFDWLNDHRPGMFPNRLIVEYVDDILDLNGELIEIIRAYYQEKILLLPRLVEINRGGYNH